MRDLGGWLQRWLDSVRDIVFLPRGVDRFETHEGDIAPLDPQFQEFPSAHTGVSTAYTSALAPFCRLTTASDTPRTPYKQDVARCTWSAVLMWAGLWAGSSDRLCPTEPVAIRR
jgi:hypothetical protein